ncbi:MAG TPA: helix-turn-helix transcriptional regulator [Acidimicrobiales bacterium]|jgi:DNA-binding PadR family transcriptional regulator|nr:helix-turn-helix transcriptional regulator [Acidimicrobiales bacterium]
MTNSTPTAAGGEGASRFELAPPRRFILPAILLLLSEQPGYGYGLVPRLGEFHFGHVDRPAVYRALAQLEQDGLVEAISQNPAAVTARREYGVTPLGERVLRIWMGVIKEEHGYLGQTLRRYQATGTSDAVLAEVEGGWSSALGASWSPVSSTSGGRRRLMPVDTDPDPDDVTSEGVNERAVERGPRPNPLHLGRFHLVPDRCAVLVEIRSSVGPLSFGTVGVTGCINAALVDGMLRTDVAPSGSLEIDVLGLNSGNKLYDAELLRRIDARRFPTAKVELRQCSASGSTTRYRLAGELTFHGVTRPAEGNVSVASHLDRRLIITGEQVFDIREFDLPSPTMLMLRMYPDVRVRLHAEAELEEAR